MAAAGRCWSIEVMAPTAPEPGTDPWLTVVLRWSNSNWLTSELFVDGLLQVCWIADEELDDVVAHDVIRELSLRMVE